MLRRGRRTTVAAPTVSPAYIGVGYIIGPGTGVVEFLRQRVRVGLLIPLLIYFLGPQLQSVHAGGRDSLKLAGLGKRMRYGASSCGRSRWAA